MSEHKTDALEKKEPGAIVKKDAAPPAVKAKGELVKKESTPPAVKKGPAGPPAVKRDAVPARKGPAGPPADRKGSSSGSRGGGAKRRPGSGPRGGKGGRPSSPVEQIQSAPKVTLGDMLSEELKKKLKKK